MAPIYGYKVIAGGGTEFEEKQQVINGRHSKIPMNNRSVTIYLLYIFQRKRKYTYYSLHYGEILGN